MAHNFNDEQFKHLAEKLEAARLEYDKEAKDFWQKLDYESKLKAFYHVTKTIFDADVEKKASYRYVLYDAFEFGPESYMTGMDSGYLAIHNLICNGIEYDQIESAKQLQITQGSNQIQFKCEEHEYIKLYFNEKNNQAQIKIESAKNK